MIDVQAISKESELLNLIDRSRKFCKKFYCGDINDFPDGNVNGNFSLKIGSENWDLYGAIDAAYSFYTIDQLTEISNSKSRSKWADKILSCQDENGWFSYKNIRGHSKEHATAYAIGALKILEVEDEENYVSKIKPLSGIKLLIDSEQESRKWINNLGFKLTTKDIAGNLGWHYVWRSSHIGGGVPAALGMVRHLAVDWWGSENGVDEWFEWYFTWLNNHVNPKTGYWQKAFWNIFYKKPNIIDMPGAVHFYWVYVKYGYPLPHPRKILTSTLSTQKPTGLYRDYPMCIDLDGNFCLTRSLNEIPNSERDEFGQSVKLSLERNYEGILKFMTNTNLEEIYNDSHGIPGALAALAECKEIGDTFKYSKEVSRLNNPFEITWWI